MNDRRTLSHSGHWTGINSTGAQEPGFLPALEFRQPSANYMSVDRFMTEKRTSPRSSTTGVYRPAAKTSRPSVYHLPGSNINLSSGRRSIAPHSQDDRRPTPYLIVIRKAEPKNVRPQSRAPTGDRPSSLMPNIGPGNDHPVAVPDPAGRGPGRGIIAGQESMVSRQSSFHKSTIDRAMKASRISGTVSNLSNAPHSMSGGAGDTRQPIYSAMEPRSLQYRSTDLAPSEDRPSRTNPFTITSTDLRSAVAPGIYASVAKPRFRATAAQIISPVSSAWIPTIANSAPAFTNRSLPSGTPPQHTSFDSLSEPDTLPSDPIEQTEIHLDGQVLGQWVVNHLQRALTRPQTSANTVNPRVTPPWLGQAALA